MQRLQSLLALLPSDISCYTKESIGSLLWLSSNISSLTASLAFPYESCTGPFKILSIISNFAIMSSLKVATRRRRLSETNLFKSEGLESLLFSTSEIYASDMVAGQLPVYRTDSSGIKYVFASSSFQDKELLIRNEHILSQNISYLKIENPGDNRVSVISYNAGTGLNADLMVKFHDIFK